MATIVYKPSLPWLARPKDPVYGRCLAGVLDLTGGMATGRQALAEELARMSITDRGTNVVDPDYGYNTTQHLNGRIKPADMSECAAELSTQYRRDDRVVDAQVAVQFLGGVLIITSTITDGDGPFPLTLSVADAGAQILFIGT